MQGTPHSSAAPDRRRIKRATFRVSLENLASKNLLLRNRLDQKLGTRGGVALQPFRKSRGASRRTHLGSRWAFSQSLRRTCSTSSWFSQRRAWFWVRRSCTRTPGASITPPRALPPSGSVPPAAATEARVGSGAGPGGGAVSADQAGPRSEHRRAASRGLLAGEATASGPEAGGGIRLRGSAHGLPAPARGGAWWAGPPAASGAGRARRCLK